MDKYYQGSVYPLQRHTPPNQAVSDDEQDSTSILGAKARTDRLAAQHYEANDIFKDQYLASGADRYIHGPLFRWDWNEGGAERDRFWGSKLQGAWFQIDTPAVRSGSQTLPCPPLPPPQGSLSESAWFDLRHQVRLGGTPDIRARAQATEERILADARSVNAPENQVLLDREGYVTWQASQLAKLSAELEAKLDGKDGRMTTTALQRYAESSTYAEWRWYERRSSQKTANMIREKEVVMNLTEADRKRKFLASQVNRRPSDAALPSHCFQQQQPIPRSEAAKSWDKAERAWNKQVYAEQVGWTPAQPWYVPEPRNITMHIPRSNVMWPIAGLVPGFVPPPKWPLTRTQFEQLQQQGEIDAGVAYSSTMPRPERPHNMGDVGGRNEQGFPSIFANESPVDGIRPPVMLGGSLSRRRSAPVSSVQQQQFSPTRQAQPQLTRAPRSYTPREERFSIAGFDTILKLPSSGQNSAESNDGCHHHQQDRDDDEGNTSEVGLE